MKTLNLYYVYDKVGETTVTSVIPASSHLTAALGFRNAYITNKENKLNYKNLKLKCCGSLDIQFNGELRQSETFPDFSLDGGEVIEYIRDQINEKGLDDGFLDDEEET